jgi:D-alanine-D-alanine ligase
MKVVVLFDGISALGKSPDLAILETVEAVENVLSADGHEPVRVPVNPDGRWVERVRRAKADLAFNLCEGIDGVATLESAVISSLELIGLPYTGSGSWTTSVCLRKHVVNSLLEAARLPVPRFGVARVGEPLPSVGYPAICKPAAEDASLGVEQKSIVKSARALQMRVSEMHAAWNEIVVQRFIAGREVNVGILADQVLPIAEIDFSGMPDQYWQIVSYRSKWETGSDEDLGSVPRCPADLPAELTAELGRIALAAWRAVGGRGYGRVDLRIDENMRPWILEVNANPDFAPNAGLARMARTAGIDYAAMVRLVCEQAFAQPREMTEERWARKIRLSGVEAVG